MATMADLDVLALALPETTREDSGDGRPAYKAHGQMFSVIAAGALTPSTPIRASGSTTS